MGKKTVVVGLSGGVDSSVAADMAGGGLLYRRRKWRLLWS